MKKLIISIALVLSSEPHSQPHDPNIGAPMKLCNPFATHRISMRGASASCVVAPVSGAH